MDDYDKHTLVGVHIFGEGSNELVQLGSILIHANVTLETISHTPFAAVTLSALFATACMNALQNSRYSRFKLAV